MQPRPYQQRIINAALASASSFIEPVVFEAATGAGKSPMIAWIAKALIERSGKRVLSIVPTKELCEQNQATAKLLGVKASVYCASISKSLTGDLITGTPQSISNAIKSFNRLDFCCVIIDEAHETTPTIRALIDVLRIKNPLLRVIGCTATPYRLGEGYIFNYWPDGTPQGEKGYYHKLIERVTAGELIEAGYLTAVTTDYDETKETYGAEVWENDRAFEGQGRKTSAIVADIVAKSQGRMGVMIFAATVAHALEVMASLPPSASAAITGDTQKNEREGIVSRFKNRRIKYLVSVGTLTRGFDAAHVDTIAVLRSTDSAALFQQIVGRGLRLHDDKEKCLLLDYAGNIERHELQDDLFNPEIKEFTKKEAGTIQVPCPTCQSVNPFGARPNPDKLEIKDGYFVDLDGHPVLPAHFGRRCYGHTIKAGKAVRCEHRWESKECEACHGDNDIAAKYCEHCRAELVDPNEKLNHDAGKIARSPYDKITEKVLSMQVKQMRSKSGNDCLEVIYVTPTRKALTVYYMPDVSSQWVRHKYEWLSLAVYGKVCPSAELFVQAFNKHGRVPNTITYSKDQKTKYFNVSKYDEPEQN